MYLIYNILYALYALAYLPYLLLSRRGYDGFAMRFGRFPAGLQDQIRSKPNLWLHAVSVGEVMVLDGFIGKLKERTPSHQIIVTVTTKTGYALARERLGQKALVVASPLDFSFIVEKFIALIRPKIYIAVETEIWPNLFRQLSANKVPIAVINGRISDASLGRYNAVKFLLKNVLNQVSLWCMQSKLHAQRIMDLGADPSKVAVTGNIKFDGAVEPAPAAVRIAEPAKELWVAGSIHPGEDEIVLDVYAKLIKSNPSWRLVMAPRHVERVPKILELIAQRGLKAVKLSEFHKAPDEIVVVDTIGLLRSLYAQASLVFVGKSLCIGGGHNVIEPASCGKAVIVGPKVANFRDVVACFKERNAMLQVQDAAGFEKAVLELCAEPLKRQELGRCALEVVMANQGAAKRSLDKLMELLP